MPAYELSYALCYMLMHCDGIKTVSLDSSVKK